MRRRQNRGGFSRRQGAKRVAWLKRVMAIALDEKLPMSALERNRYFAAARGRRDQRQRRISGEGNSPANRQSVRCGQPHAHAGTAARPAINEKDRKNVG